MAGTTIANYTPDEIIWKHVGEKGFLKPGDVVDFDDARANHILNKWGARGLVVLKFGDDPEKKKEEAMDTYREFWELQVTMFNRQNETRRNENKAYTFPPKQLREKAQELGYELIGPWRVNPVASDERVEELKKENAAQKAELGAMVSKIDNLENQINALIEAFTSSDAAAGDTKKKGK